MTLEAVNKNIYLGRKTLDLKLTKRPSLWAYKTRTRGVTNNLKAGREFTEEANVLVTHHTIFTHCARKFRSQFHSKLSK